MGDNWSAKGPTKNLYILNPEMVQMTVWSGVSPKEVGSLRLAYNYTKIAKTLGFSSFSGHFPNFQHLQKDNARANLLDLKSQSYEFKSYYSIIVNFNQQFIILQFSIIYHLKSRRFMKQTLCLCIIFIRQTCYVQTSKMY